MGHKVLFAVTNHRQLGTTGKTTGYDLLHITHALYELERTNHEVVFTSPLGGACFMDENTRDIHDPLNRDYLGRASFVERLNNTKRPQDLVGDEFSGILFIGGHGCLWDFRDSGEFQRLALEILKAKGFIASIGHGATALLDIKLENRESIVKGRNLTASTNAEDEAVGLLGGLPFSLENELKQRGANYLGASLWQRHCIVDDVLITGQNLASARAVGEAMVKHLRLKN